MLIPGDCLPVLRTLIENPKIKGKVKLIYIDPPFSTGREFRLGAATISVSEKNAIAYVDVLSGAEYLEFLRERLILMKEICEIPTPFRPFWVVKSPISAPFNLPFATPDLHGTIRGAAANPVRDTQKTFMRLLPLPSYVLSG